MDQEGEGDDAYGQLLDKYGVQRVEDRVDERVELRDDRQSVEALREAEEEEDIRRHVEERRERQRLRTEERTQRRKGSANPLRKRDVRKGWEEYDTDAATPTPDERPLHGGAEPSPPPERRSPPATDRPMRRERRPVSTKETAKAGWLIQSGPADSSTLFTHTAGQNMALQAHHLELPHPTRAGKMLVITLPPVRGWRIGNGTTRS